MSLLQLRSDQYSSRVRYTRAFIRDFRPWHQLTVVQIVAAGTRKENPVRTIIIYPGQIYGVGRGEYFAIWGCTYLNLSNDYEGVQKTTLWLRIFLDYAKKVGYAGTWGPGKNIQNVIHVLDMADIMMLVFKAALEGKADEGAQGFCQMVMLFSAISADSPF